MTTLLLEELRGTALVQPFSVKLRHRINVAGIRFYAYSHNSPAGTFIMSLFSGVNLIASGNFTSLDIENAHINSDKYIHGIFLVEFDYPVILNYGDYELRLTSSGYVFSESAYLGWVKRHEDVTNRVDYVVIDDSYNPLTFELWDYKRSV